MQQSQLYAVYETDAGLVVEFMKFVGAEYGLPDNPTILDIGCGPGRLLESLSQIGWAVTGHEPDPDYAPAARETIDGLPGAEFSEAGFSDLNACAAFDFIAAVNGPYSYLLEPDARRDALQRCARALRPGGVILLDLSNFLWILKNSREPSEVRVEVDGVEVKRLAEHRFDYHQGVMTHQDSFSWVDASGTKRFAQKTHRMAQEMTDTQITGGRQCGAIKYQAFRGKSKTVAHCYCQMCRKLTGGSFVSYAEFPLDGFSFTKGQPKHFKSSEFAVRGFCGDCGGHVTYQYYDEREEIINSVWIVVGSLDSLEDLVPTDIIYAPDKLPWLKSDERLAQWPGQMPWLRPGIDE